MFQFEIAAYNISHFDFTIFFSEVAWLTVSKEGKYVELGKSQLPRGNPIPLQITGITTSEIEVNHTYSTLLYAYSNYAIIV
jgi:hypothetical protein